MLMWRGRKAEGRGIHFATWLSHGAAVGAIVVAVIYNQKPLGRDLRTL
jgi:hypothetical protein